MKTCFTLFFGILFVIIGLDIILRFLFKISLPLFKIFIALFFIYIGITMLVGKPFFNFKRCCPESTDVFGEFSCSLRDREIDRDHISVVFGSKNVDLTGVRIKGARACIKADCVFGQMKIKLDPQVPVRIFASSAFGQVILPENNRVSFGNGKYESENLSPDKPYLELEVSAVFGETVVLK
jgi:predicted membrane protein